MPTMLARPFTAVAVAAVASVGVEAAPAEKSTVAIKCAGNSAPYQVLSHGSNFEMVDWGWADGQEKTVWSIPKSSVPKVKKINACGISPKDSNVYCMASYEGGDNYLTRVDKDGFAFVASSPAWSASATFDEGGTYYMDTGDKVYKSLAPDMLTGYESPWSGLPALSKLSGKASHGHGYDSVVSNGLYITMNKGKVVVTDLSDMKTWKPIENSPAGLNKVAYGGAYWFNGEIFFSANDGSGVYKMTPDPKFESYTMARIGKSFVTDKNDGLNCLLSEPPETSTESSSTLSSSTPASSSPTSSTNAPSATTTTEGQESMPASVADAMAQGAAQQPQRLWSQQAGGGSAGPVAPAMIAIRTPVGIIGAASIAALAALVLGVGIGRVAWWWPRATGARRLATSGGQEEAGLVDDLLSAGGELVEGDV